MRVTVQRQTKTLLSVSGEMTIGGSWAAWTLENAQYAIPAGIYQLELYASPKFGRLMPRLVDVPGCPYCEIHFGNYPLNYAGCIGVGTMRSADAIWNTQSKFEELYPLLEAAIKTEGADIQVIDPPLSTGFSPGSPNAQ